MRSVRIATGTAPALRFPSGNPLDFLHFFPPNAGSCRIINVALCPFCEEPMLQIPRPTPTCTRFKASIEMPCIKCGTQMRLTLVEPRDQNFDLLTYSCMACDCSEVFLSRSGT
jgi:hypothetical protein